MRWPLMQAEPAAPPRRKVGLALGSGSARGLAHIGVLRALREANIEADLIAGSSVGALVGAAYASGKLEPLETAFRGFDWKTVAFLLDPVFPRSGLIDGRKIAAFVRTHVPPARIEELPLPFRAVATDIMTGDEVAIDAGDIIEAVRASIAIPGILTPVRSNGRVLADGGLVNPVPVSTARAMGADIVIAVDLNHDVIAHRMSLLKPPPDAKPNVMARLLDGINAIDNPALAQFRAWLQQEPLPGIFDVLAASIYITQARITEANLRYFKPDVLIQPPLGGVKFLEFHRAEEIIEIGYRAACEQLEASAFVFEEPPATRKRWWQFR
ncbi:MAG: patatin-like phospholipase family protein [Burkholderiales bacterium]|nr:patatin-like phospholipase family protein [Burkholderiales bacterium]